MLLVRTKKEFPRFNIKERSKSWLKPVFWLLGKLTGRDYDGFTTTIFSTMYVGPTWADRDSESKYMTLRHEKEHVRQFHCWPLGRWAWPLNHLLTTLCYLFILPMVFTMRARFEREGYLQTLLVEAEITGNIPLSRMKYNARWIAETFGGPTYLYMWRWQVAYDWAMETQKQINAGAITNERDRVSSDPWP